MDYITFIGILIIGISSIFISTDINQLINCITDNSKIKTVINNIKHKNIKCKIAGGFLYILGLLFIYYSDVQSTEELKKNNFTIINGYEDLRKRNEELKEKLLDSNTKLDDILESLKNNSHQADTHAILKVEKIKDELNDYIEKNVTNELTQNKNFHPKIIKLNQLYDNIKNKIEIENKNDLKPAFEYLKYFKQLEESRSVIIILSVENAINNKIKIKRLCYRFLTKKINETNAELKYYESIKEPDSADIEHLKDYSKELISYYKLYIELSEFFNDNNTIEITNSLIKELEYEINK